MTDRVMVRRDIGVGHDPVPIGGGLEADPVNGFRIKRLRYTLSTNGTTPAVMTPDPANPVLPANSVWAIRGSVVGIKPSTMDCIGAHVTGAIKKGAAAANTALVGSAGITIVEDQAGTNVALSADTTNGDLDITVTGLSGAMNWVAEIDFVQAS